ncbi:MAG: AMP-binding protein [Chromatiales bacterium]|nr:AMP-binding protein [Chromatiales bacterium]
MTPGPTASPLAPPPTFQHLSLAGGIRAAMHRAPDKLACRHRDRTRTYRELLERIDRVTAGLAAGLGLRPGQHGAIVGKNSIEYLEIVLGASQAGVALATVNPRLSLPEIVAICDDAEARVIFADPESATALRDAALAAKPLIIAIGPELEAWLARATPASQVPLVREWDAFTIPYTSGTTGKPKGVLVPHRSRILTLFGMAVEYGCYAPDDRFLAIAPMCHGAGMIFSLAPVFFGGYAEIMDRFDPEEVLERLGGQHITGFFGVPTHFHALLAASAPALAGSRNAPLKAVISNAAALPQAMKERLVAHFGPGLLHETYGSTEAGIVANLRPPDQLRKLQCVGQPFPCTEVEVRRQDGTLCGPDEVGELFSRSPYLFNGYWGRPQETAESFRDGWVTVGDLARRDGEGYLYIVDRLKDMVISGGVNIYPREVEEVIVQHPGVVEAAVIGIPDEKWGEALKAFVVPRAGADVGADELLAFLASRIARMKLPKQVEFIGQIPRNANGKVLKTALRARN